MRNDGLDPRLWVIYEIGTTPTQRRAGGEGGVSMPRAAAVRIDLGPPASWQREHPAQTKDREGVRTLVGTRRACCASERARLPGGKADQRLSRRSPHPAGREASSLGWHARLRPLRLDGERFRAVPLGPSISEVYSLEGGGDEDPGALWVGTRTAGLLRLEAGSWLALDRSSGLPADQVLGLLETKDAAGQPVYWVGTADGLAVIRGGHVSVEGKAQGLPGQQVLALAELRERGRAPLIWASIVGLGLVKRVGERWVRVPTRPAFDADHGVWLLASTAPDGARCSGSAPTARARTLRARPLERAHKDNSHPTR